MNRRLALALLLWIALTPAMSTACSVPVFRYALERWDRDLYQVIIVKDGAFTEDEVTLAQALKAKTVLGQGFLNAHVSIADVSDAAMRETLLGMYPRAVEQATTDEPILTLLYPREHENKDILWQAPFSQSSIDLFQESASNMLVADALLAGASTVFVLLESGDANADNAAFETLQTSANHLQESLEIPEGIIGTDGEVTGGRLTSEQARSEDPSNQLKSGIPLQISFQVVRLTHSPILRSILLNMEEGLLTQTGHPMAFPIFGRGRVLPPMVGEAINPENIALAANYLCGACSCQMKAQNPGIDSLSDLDWRGYLDGSEVIQARELPPLTGFLANSSIANEMPQTKQANSPMLRNTLIVGTTLLLGLVVGSALITRRSSP